MGSDKTNVFLVAIVGIVAVAGLVFLFSGRGSIATVSAEKGLSGAAINVADIASCTSANTQPGEIDLYHLGDNIIQLSWYNGAGNQVHMPLVIDGKSTLANLGLEKENVHLIETEAIKKNDFFVLTPKNSKKSYLLQYKGADVPSKTNPKIKFKNTGSGETLKYSISKSGQSTIVLGGYKFRFKPAKPITSDDFPILVDLDGNGNFGSTLPITIYNFGGSITYTFSKYLLDDAYFKVAEQGKSFEVFPKDAQIFNVQGITLKVVSPGSTEGLFGACNYLTIKHPNGQPETFGFTLSPQFTIIPE